MFGIRPGADRTYVRNLKEGRGDVAGLHDMDNLMGFSFTFGYGYFMSYFIDYSSMKKTPCQLPGKGFCIIL